MTTDITPYTPTVILITGFLGSGKTTFLKHLLANTALGTRNAIIVNDFGSEVFDQSLLRVGETLFADVPGGCLCCSALENFHSALNDILPLRPERIFIETTGLADPVQVRYDMAVLGIPVSLTLCVVDAQNFLKERRLSATAEHQVRTSNIILLARQDCATSVERETVLTVIAELNPRAPILHLAHGKLSAEARALLFAEQTAFDEKYDPLQEHLVRDAISAYKLTLTDALTFDQMNALLQALPANVLRCKGRAMLMTTHEQAEPYMINVVCGSWDYFPISTPSQNHSSSLFVIGHSVEQTSLTTALQAALTQSHYTGTLHIKEGMIRSIGIPDDSTHSMAAGVSI